MEAGMENKKYIVIIDGEKFIVEALSISDDAITLKVNQNTHIVKIAELNSAHLNSYPETAETGISKSDSGMGGVDLEKSGSIIAPMPGEIVEINVAAGDSVIPGQEVCVLEAMKMKNKIRSPKHGKIKRIAVSAGQFVEYGTILVEIE